ERVIDQVMALADQLRGQAAEAEQIGKLTDDTVKLMKGAGLIRLLQTKQYGGFEVHPREFAETTMATAALYPPAGWIVGGGGGPPGSSAWWACTRISWRTPPRRSRPRSGPTTSTPGWRPRTRRKAWPSRWTAAISSTAAGSSARAPTTATGSSWAHF